MGEKLGLCNVLVSRVYDFGSVTANVLKLRVTCPEMLIDVQKVLARNLKPLLVWPCRSCNNRFLLLKRFYSKLIRVTLRGEIPYNAPTAPSKTSTISQVCLSLIRLNISHSLFLAYSVRK